MTTPIDLSVDEITTSLDTLVIKKINSHDKYSCHFSNCVSEYTNKYSLSSHLKKQHILDDIIVETIINSLEDLIIPCDIIGCSKIYKRSDMLVVHKQKVHGIGIKWKYCSEIINGIMCQSKYTHLPDLKKHKMLIHNINKIHYICNESYCGKELSDAGHLIRHKALIHNINIKKIYKCDYNSCKFESQLFDNMKQHQVSIHDIGLYKCDYCHGNKNTSNIYTELNGNTFKICKMCFNKINVVESRKERKMSIYLDLIPEIYNFLIGSDTSFRNMGGCNNKRPDKLYYGTDINGNGIILWIECDEFQHSGSASYSCDETRIIDCYFQEFCNNEKLVVIRWNPDYCKSLKGKYITFMERLVKLQEIILQILKNPPDELIYIYYMYYNDDSKLLPKNIKYKLIL